MGRLLAPWAQSGRILVHPSKPHLGKPQQAHDVKQSACDRLRWQGSTRSLAKAAGSICLGLISSPRGGRSSTGKEPRSVARWNRTDEREACNLATITLIPALHPIVKQQASQLSRKRTFLKAAHIHSRVAT